MNFRVVDWFYVQNGRKIGPVPAVEFDDLVQSCRITPETLVWRDGLLNWQPLGSILSQRSSDPALAQTLPSSAGPQERPVARTKCAECGLAFLESEMLPYGDGHEPAAVGASVLVSRYRPIPDTRKTAKAVESLAENSPTWLKPGANDNANESKRGEGNREAPKSAVAPFSNLRLPCCSMNFRPMDWFYVQNGRQVGPVPVKQFDDLVRSGRITLQTLVWRDGLSDWQPFGSISAASPSLPTPKAPPPPPGAPPSGLPGALATCAECAFAFPESEMIPFGGSWVCAKCKPLFFQRVREGAPLAAGGAEAWQSGDAVVTLNGGALPVRCVKCNGAVTGKHIPRTLHWHSEWVYILLLSPLIYLIVSLIVRKSARVSVPICEEHRQRRRVAIGVSWGLIVLGIASIIAAISIDSAVLYGLAFATVLAAIVLGLWMGTLVSAKKIDAQYVWVRGFCKEYRALLPEFPNIR